ICIQHELEHLEGIVYIDHLSPTKRQRLLDQMMKRQRENI
ncbi:peptide deformylase, partial [Candidatus Dependentiae bacterium]|nr:peptide deformylase [Candidatus Dependentiae bacterium]